MRAGDGRTATAAKPATRLAMEVDCEERVVDGGEGDSEWRRFRERRLQWEGGDSVTSDEASRSPGRRRLRDYVRDWR